jgi:hypothetical protein
MLLDQTMKIRSKPGQPFRLLDWLRLDRRPAQAVQVAQLEAPRTGSEVFQTRLAELEGRE